MSGAIGSMRLETFIGQLDKIPDLVGPLLQSFSTDRFENMFFRKMRRRYSDAKTLAKSHLLAPSLYLTFSSLFAAPVSDFHMLTKSLTTGVILILAATRKRLVASSTVKPRQ